MQWSRNESRSIVRAVLGATSSVCNVSVPALVSQMRCRPSVEARWVVMLVATEHYGLSLSHIGRHLGGRHHTTVLHGLRAAKKLVATDAEFAGKIAAVEMELNAGKAVA